MKTQSVNQVTIRLPDERWIHITEEHCEMAGLRIDVLDVVANPEKIFEGTNGELLAIRAITLNKWLVVVYKEVSLEDGFIITAFMTKRINSLNKRRVIYERPTV